MVATAVRLSFLLTPNSPGGSAWGKWGLSAECVHESVFVWESQRCDPMAGFFPPRAGHSDTGKHAPNQAQMAAADRRPQTQTL